MFKAWLDCPVCGETSIQMGMAHGEPEITEQTCDCDIEDYLQDIAEEFRLEWEARDEYL